MNITKVLQHASPCRARRRYAATERAMYECYSRRHRAPRLGARAGSSRGSVRRVTAAYNARRWSKRSPDTMPVRAEMMRERCLYAMRSIFSAHPRARHACLLRDTLAV